jgi:hypothetical protein
MRTTELHLSILLNGRAFLRQSAVALAAAPLLARAAAAPPAFIASRESQAAGRPVKLTSTFKWPVVG